MIGIRSSGRDGSPCRHRAARDHIPRAGRLFGFAPCILATQRAIDPVGETRDDYDIFAGLAARLGIGVTFTQRRSTRNWLTWAWGRTRDALAARGIEAPSFDVFWGQGYFKLPPPEPYAQFAGFRADPSGAPLDSPAGRIMLANRAVDGPGHPHWHPRTEWLGGTNAAIHPLHLLSPQPAKRRHGQMEASRISAREKMDGREKLRISLPDATRLGLSRGALVDVWSDIRSCIAVAWPEEGLMEHVVLLPTGAHIADRSTSEIGQGCAAQSCPVSVARRKAPAAALRAHDLPECVAPG